MANPHKGEVAFEAGGRTYKLRYSANALCELEDAVDKPLSEIAEILSDPKKMRIKMVRAVLWAGLTDNHLDVTIKDAGLIVGELTMPKALGLIGDAFALAYPVADVEARPPVPDSPAKPDGTGPAS